jgi:hypothetical protein
MALTYVTETSEDIISYLKSRGFNLCLADREFIREKTYDAIVAAGEAESNGCDCGQIGCPICS